MKELTNIYVQKESVRFLIFSFVDARNVKWLEIRENIRSLRFGFGCNGVEVLLLRRWEMHSYTTILPAAAVSPIFS